MNRTKKKYGDITTSVDGFIPKMENATKRQLHSLIVLMISIMLINLPFVPLVEAGSVTYTSGPVNYTASKIVTDVAGKGPNGNITSANQNVSYQIIVNNTGSEDLYNVTVNDSMIGINNVTNLTARSSETFSGNYTVNQTDIDTKGNGTGLIINNVTVSCDDNPDGVTTNATVSIKMIPAIFWNNPDDIVYGTPLTDTQLDAVASVNGTFTYDPAAETVLGVGQHTLHVDFTPEDTANYTTAVDNVSINVTNETPEILWNNPDDIVYGTPLTDTQLDAVASVNGTYTYTPPNGTVLDVGQHTLYANFTPEDTANYTNASANVTINVMSVTPTLVFPVANFSSNVTSGYAPLDVQFNDNSDDATGWYWDFGDENNSTVQNPIHIFENPGIYKVNLTATNENGTNSTFANIIVSRSFNYTFKDSNTIGGPTYDWIEISGTGNQVLNESDDNVQDNVNLGFFFNYYGTDYSRLAIANNGLLFSSGTTYQYVNDPIRQSPGVHGVISPYWDDLVTENGGKIYYQTLGTAPNRIFITEWVDNQHYSNSEHGITFETILYEGSNNIEYQYKNTTFGNVTSSTGNDLPPYDNGGSATVGIESPDGGDGLQYSYNQQVIYPELAILFKFPQYSGTNLHLSKQASISKDHGSSMSYTLYYSNLGILSAHDVVLEDRLPNNVNFESASDGGTYNSSTRIVSWDIGLVNATSNGYKTLNVSIPQDVSVGTVIINDVIINTSDLEVRYDDNEAQAQTRVTGSSLPSNVTVEPNNGGIGIPSVYWGNPVSFTYHSCNSATGVGIRIHFDDGSQDIVGNMAGGPPDWSHNLTFYPRHGNANVTYTVYGCSAQNVSFSIYVDPAGYIYDADSGQRITNASVWLQRPDSYGGWENVPTSENPPVSQPDINPLVSDSDGGYQWNVLNGTYRVHVEASGYIPADSIVVSVPPPVTDLAIGLHHIVLPVANFSSNVTSGYAPFDVQFNDNSDNATGWYWDFGDGNNLTEQNPVHTYYTVGNYTVNLTVSNENGTDSELATINVSKAIPIISWSDPADIVYETSLDETQLNANASVNGTYTYDPAAGAVLGVGQHTLNVEFAPEDTANYTTASKDVSINVTNATPQTTQLIVDKTVVDVAGNGTDENITSPGDVITYQINVNNTGGIDLTNVVVTDPLIRNLAGDNDTVLNPKENWTYTGNYTVTKADITNNDGNGLVNNVNVVCDQNITANDNATVQIATNASIEGSVTDVAGRGPDGNVTAAGDIITYQVIVTNTGTADITNATVNGTNIMGPDSSINNDTVFNSGEIWTYTGNYTVTPADMDNNGTVQGGLVSGAVKWRVKSTEASAAEGGYITIPVKFDSDQYGPRSPINPIRVLIESNPNGPGKHPHYSIFKTVINPDADGDCIINNVGDEVPYRIVVQNDGDKDLTNVAVDDTMISLDGPTGDYNDDRVMHPGETWEYNGIYKLTHEDVERGGIENIATVSCDQLPEKSVTLDTPVDQNPDLSIYKSVTGIDEDGDHMINNPGDVINYQVAVKNNGDMDLTGVSVSDPMVDLTKVSGDQTDPGVLNPGETWIYEGDYTVTESDIYTDGDGTGYITNTATVNCNELPEESSFVELQIAKTNAQKTENNESKLPVAYFSTSVTSGYAPLSVQFTDNSQNAAAWNWDFGDSTSATEKSPVHIYNTPGTYTAKLIVSNSSGAVSQPATAAINVLQTTSSSGGGGNGGSIRHDNVVSTVNTTATPSVTPTQTNTPVPEQTVTPANVQTPKPTSTGTPAKQSKKTPGFEVISGVIGLLGAVYMFRKR